MLAGVGQYSGVARRTEASFYRRAADSKHAPRRSRSGRFARAQSRPDGLLTATRQQADGANIGSHAARKARYHPIF